MGIRFQCHHCGHALHVKDFQAGKRGRCPECKGQFRVPAQDALHSLDISESKSSSENSAISNSSTATNHSGAAVASASVATSRRNSSVHDANTDSFPPHANQAVIESEVRGAVVSPEESVHSEHAGVSPSDSLDPSYSEGDDKPANVVGDVSNANLQLPEVISAAPNATWYVRTSAGGQYGPAPAAVFWQWVGEGRVGVDALVWRDDWPQWQPSSIAFADFFSGVRTAASGVSAAASVIPPAEVTQQQAAKPGHSLSPSVLDEAITTPKSSIANRELRKRVQRKRYSIAIAVLVLLFIGLAVGLAIVVYRQGFPAQ